MAHAPRGAVGQTAQNPNAAQPSNGLHKLASTESAGAAGVNRKKQKRRQKEAAKRAAEFEQERAAPNVNNGHPAPAPPNTSNPTSLPQKDFQGASYGDQDIYDDDQYYSEDYDQQYDPTYPDGEQLGQSGTGKKSKKKKKNKAAPQSDPYPYPPQSRMHPRDNYHHAHGHPHTHVPPPPPPPPPPSMSHGALRAVQRNSKADRIWNTSTQEERERIKEFWLSLGEDERKSLVKIEKEAVLRKMKEQQKHSCSCTVCGRKRTAIEEELEVLYDAYYEELEQYGHRGSPTVLGVSKFSVPKLDYQHQSRLPPDGMPTLMHHPTQPSHGHIEELPDDEEDDEDDDADDEDYSDEEDYDEDEDYSDEEPEELPRPTHQDFFNFGNSLTVKGGILTVADDLLKNDGKKFIEMMEQLAERRMQREEEAQYAAAAHPTSYQDPYRHSHGPAPDEDDYDDEDDEDYDSQEEYDEEEEDMDTMTEEQRMQEGRRMFQIFAARMFEQRVLTAYREKVARERQQKLLEELDEEKTHDAAREAKKARDAEKKKQKKQAQKQKLAEEKARKEAEKAAEEAAIKEAELKKQEELKKRREEQRLKKEEQRKAQEAEAARKNAEKLKRQKEEQDRRQEAERKAREQKETERKAREEAKKKEREEREAREREAKERKAKAEKERKDREAKDKADKEASERARKDGQAAQQAHAVQQAAQAAKRAVAPGPTPIPPGLHKQPSGYSPHVSVATPAIPKAPTPGRPRQGSQRGASPKATHVAIGQAKTNSPPVGQLSSGSVAPKTILSRPPSQPPVTAAHIPHPGSPMHGLPPPGMQIPLNSLFGGMQNMNGYQQNQGPMMPQRSMAQPMPGMFGSPQAPIGSGFRPFPPNGMPGPPPGMMGMPLGRGFPDVPPGFNQQMPGGPSFGMPNRDAMPMQPQQHSRQQSGSSSIEQPSGLPNQPIQRPAPIQRPSSVKPQDGRDIDELSKHLGSSALLDDEDSPEPPLFQDRRPSMAPGMAAGLPRGGSGLTNAFAPPLYTNVNQPRMDGFGNPPGSTWGTPNMPFGQSPATNGGWGPSPTSSWPMSTNALPFGNNAPGLTGRSRAFQIRINMCNACKTLTAAKGGSAEGFQSAQDIFAEIRDTMSPPVQDEEIGPITETEGNVQNGGGRFLVNKTGPGPLDMVVKWSPEPSGGPSMAGIGQIGGGIGSPVVGAREPASNNATPFGSMRGFPNIPNLGGLGATGM